MSYTTVSEKTELLSYFEFLVLNLTNQKVAFLTWIQLLLYENTGSPAKHF